MLTSNMAQEKISLEWIECYNIEFFQGLSISRFEKKEERIPIVNYTKQLYNLYFLWNYVEHVSR